MPHDLTATLLAMLGPTFIEHATRAVLVLVVGLAVARLLGWLAGRALVRAGSPDRAYLARRVVFYGLGAIALVTSLREVGIDLSLLLGAAGILTVAIGFAAQTSASNFISGLFLLGERPFALGDVVRIGGTTGEVLAIDLLSVKLRTFDNLYVRIPNEAVIKTEVTNLTRFPIRRVDFQIDLAPGQDLAVLERTLIEVADAHRRVLDDPRPAFAFMGWTLSGAHVQFSAWAAAPEVAVVRNELAAEIQRAFERDGVAFAHADSVASPPAAD